jgi:hypothetical protein
MAFKVKSFQDYDKMPERIFRKEFETMKKYSDHRVNISEREKNELWLEAK